ncbi:acyl-CoA dehydrogenase family protein [Novosphingobium sp.]|uniref:acyl-CoA dehydrogenase family protein n=1 Tax=Novosphingobium sp. TaxID=1874826 RepID=UPI0025D37043|nr:acyl-CoA dehydrogenase family protein [Novosphingobium sp.]
MFSLTWRSIPRTCWACARGYEGWPAPLWQSGWKAAGSTRNSAPAHGLAWIATNVARARGAAAAWEKAGAGLNPLDALVTRLGFAETLAQLVGGLPMGQDELLRPADLSPADAARDLADACGDLLNADRIGAPTCPVLAQGFGPRKRLATPISARSAISSAALPKRKSCNAHKWHLANDLIPDATVAAMAQLGAFGVCIPEEFGGLGLSKLVMCLVTEGYRAAGSARARSAPAPKSRASLSPTAVRRNRRPTGCPGSKRRSAAHCGVHRTRCRIRPQLAQTRARRTETGEWRIDGAKTPWITTPAALT